MPKRKDPDPLLTLIHALDTLWNDHLWRLLQRQGETLTPEDIDRVIGERPDDKTSPLVEAADAAIGASLPFWKKDSLDSLHHRVHAAVISVYHFLQEWAYGEIDVDAAELRRQREKFFEARDLAGRMRFGMSGGKKRDALDEVEMNPKVREAEAYIRKNQVHLPTPGNAARILRKK